MEYSSIYLEANTIVPGLPKNSEDVCVVLQG
jgi:hypothetical protein